MNKSQNDILDPIVDSLILKLTCMGAKIARPVPRALGTPGFPAAGWPNNPISHMLDSSTFSHDSYVGFYQKIETYPQV